VKIAATGLVLGILAGLTLGNVKAHDHSRPDLTPWFESLRSKGGAPCCDGKDGTSLDDPDWSMDGGHYRVRLEGKWYDVPDEAIVEGHNRAGHAVVWTYPRWMGGEEGYAIRCFMAGTMG
jgi:hypothetical protein